MHTLLGLSSLLLVVLGGYVALGSLARRGGRARGRGLQLLVLAAPLVSLGVGLGGLHHFAGRTCLLGAPPWDYTVGVALPLGMGLVALGAVGLGLLRLALMAPLVARSAVPAYPELQARAEGLAGRLGAPPPRVLLCVCTRPLAVAYGVRQPTLLLSTWMVEHLDQREMESVLAHELGHVARRDYLVLWLATVLRDAFFYLPTSWAVHHRLRHEKEVACDDLAVAATHRPLALASALAKVWQQALGGPGLRPAGTAQPLLGPGEALERRIERLLAVAEAVPSPRPPPKGRGSRSSGVVALGAGTVALAGLLALEAANVAVMLAPMGCGPVWQLGRLL